MATSHSHLEAAVEEIVRALRSYRVLTRSGLREAVNGADWPDGMFEQALTRSIKLERVLRLTDGLLEIGPREQ